MVIADVGVRIFRYNVNLYMFFRNSKWRKLIFLKFVIKLILICIKFIWKAVPFGWKRKIMLEQLHQMLVMIFI